MFEDWTEYTIRSHVTTGQCFGSRAVGYLIQEKADAGTAMIRYNLSLPRKVYFKNQSGLELAFAPNLGICHRTRKHVREHCNLGGATLWQY